MSWTRKTAGILLAVAAVVVILALTPITDAVMPSNTVEASVKNWRLVKADFAEQTSGDDVTSITREIHVTGEGRVEVEPDLALLDIGVESSGITVAEATERAASTFDAVFKVLDARRIEDDDIQTTHFSIRPEHEWREKHTDEGRTSREVLVGYKLSGQIRVKIRDMDIVGDIIDEMVATGGDDLRIQGINFTRDDMANMMHELRELAMKDAHTKAGHLAELSGLKIGKARHIEEYGVSHPFSGYYNEARYSYGIAAAAAPVAPATSISAGTFEMTLNVRVIFIATE